MANIEESLSLSAATRRRKGTSLGSVSSRSSPKLDTILNNGHNNHASSTTQPKEHHQDRETIMQKWVCWKCFTPIIDLFNTFRLLSQPESSTRTRQAFRSVFVCFSFGSTTEWRWEACKRAEAKSVAKWCGEQEKRDPEFERRFAEVGHEHNIGYRFKDSPSWARVRTGSRRASAAVNYWRCSCNSSSTWKGKIEIGHDINQCTDEKRSSTDTSRGSSIDGKVECKSKTWRRWWIFCRLGDGGRRATARGSNSWNQRSNRERSQQRWITKDLRKHLQMWSRCDKKAGCFDGQCDASN